MSRPEIGYSAFINVDLIGGVDVDAHEIGPGAARLGAATLIAEDRSSALSLAQAAMLLEDVAPYLVRRGQHREPAHDSQVTAVITISGEQRIRDFTLKRANTAANSNGFARFTLGQLRLTVHDHLSAALSSQALARAYNVAATTFGPLPSIALLRQAADERRSIRGTPTPRRLPIQTQTPARSFTMPSIDVTSR